MKKSFAAVMVVVFTAFSLFLGCAAYSVSPLTGFVYSDVKAPLVATNSPQYSKMGVAEAESILGIIARGDASIEAAIKNGGITTIHHVDFHSTSVLGIYAKFKVIVYGD